MCFGGVQVLKALEWRRRLECGLGRGILLPQWGKGMPCPLPRKIFIFLPSNGAF